ncbi:Na+/melibiose symporter [Microbacterium sp. cf046]|uniref:MFS transporter n=1 Tax=Microbacterium sp. cf046 TaxID=1761803 RepID=UPI0008EA420D|nr:MFS transporter [Microbacterium sp. cf046]SFR91895.1 Na+/melibiose symporter [Microbacterium sp. cf046]
MSIETLPATTAPEAITPMRRLVPAILASTGGASGATLAPLQLLLTIHVVAIAGTDAAIMFGFVTGAGALTAIIANPLAGRLSDRTTARLGRRRTWILGSALVGSLVMLAVMFTTEIWQVALVWAVVQAAFTVQVAITSALLADQVPPDRRGGVSGLMGLGITILPLVVLAVIGAVGSGPHQWFIAGGVGLVGGVVAVLLIRERRHVPVDRPARMSVRELLSAYWVSPVRHPAFGWAFLTRFLIYCSFATGAFTTFLLLDKFGLTTDELAPYVVGIAGVGILGIAVASVASGFISDRIQRQKPFVLVGGMLSAVGLVLTVFSPTIELLYLSFGLSAIGAGVVYAVDNALCVRMLPSSEDVAKDFGIINLASGLPASLVPFLAPALLALGGFPALYLTLAAFGVLGALSVVRLPEMGKEGDPRWAQINR